MRLLSPAGSQTPDAVTSTAPETILPLSIEIRPFRPILAATSISVVPSNNGRNAGGRSVANWPPPTTSTRRLPSGSIWWLPSTATTGSSATLPDSLPLQSDKGPVPSSARSTAGAPGSFSKRASKPPCGSETDAVTARRFSAGAYSMSATARASGSSCLVASRSSRMFGPVASIDPWREREKGRPVRAGAISMSGISICATRTPTGSEKPEDCAACGSSGSADGSGARKTSMLSMLTLSARNTPRNKADGDQSTCSPSISA